MAISRLRAPSLEIVVDDAQVGHGGLPPVQARLDDAPANVGHGFIPEIGCGFQNGPGRIQRSILLRWFNAPVRYTTLLAESLGRGFAKCRDGFAKWDRVHAGWSPLMARQARAAAPRRAPLLRHSCEIDRRPERSAMSRC